MNVLVLQLQSCKVEMCYQQFVIDMFPNTTL